MSTVISEGIPLDGATTRIFEPPQVNQDNAKPRYLGFIGSFITPEAATARPWTRGGGFEIANPCLRYVKNFLRRGRINTNGHYSCGQCSECIQNNWPMNVKWSSSKQQNRNRRNNRMITIGAETKCLSEWSELSGVGTATAWYRLKGSWTPEQAFDFAEPPSRKRKAT